MKKYKIILFVLLMIINTNVYAYNWCKGGIGENSYDICDRNTNPYLDSDEWGVGMYYTNNRTACGTLLNQCPRTIRGVIDSDMFKENKEIIAGCKEFNHYNDQLYIVNASKSFENTNKFFTNKYLINNDSYADLFNQNVVVTKKDYAVEGTIGGNTFTVVRIEIPVISENGLIVDKNYIIYVEENSSFEGVKVDNYIKFVNAFRTDPSAWPDYISVKGVSGVNGSTAAGLYVQGQSCSGCTNYGRVHEVPHIVIQDDECAATGKIKEVIEDYLIKALHIVAPILLFVLTTLDLVKGIASNKGLNGALTNFGKRALVCILIFFAGDIINILLDLAGIERCVDIATPDIVNVEASPFVSEELNEYYNEETGFVD